MKKTNNIFNSFDIDKKREAMHLGRSVYVRMYSVEDRVIKEIEQPFQINKGSILKGICL